MIPVAGGAPRKLLSNVLYGSYVWAPDSVHVAATTGERLAWIEATAGYVTTLTTITGSFNTPPSVSPASDAVAYSVLPKPLARLPRSNVFSVPVAGGQPAQLTNDNTSSAPVWGPTGIAFSRGPFGKFGQPKLNIWLMGVDGSNQRQLTHVRANSFLSGLSPLQWSASGGALLAGFFGQDTDQGYAVDPATGAVHDIGAKKFDGTSAYAISRDGTTVLATTGGVEGPGPDLAVVAIPFAGGPPDRARARRVPAGLERLVQRAQRAVHLTTPLSQVTGPLGVSG